MKKSDQSAGLPTWDLEKIYPDVDSWERDFAELRPLAERFAAFRGRLGESAGVLKEAIESLDAFERLGEKVYVYAHLKSDENTADGVNRARLNRVESLFAELAGISAFFAPEIMAIDEAKMQSFLESNTLAFYRRSIEELLKEKPHVLTEPEERILALYSEALGSAGEVFSILNDADLSFGNLKDDRGKTVELTHGSYRKLLESSDRALRRRAFTKIYKQYRQFANTFSQTLGDTVKRHAVSAKLRQYPSTLAASLSGDNVPESIYLNLIEAVNSKLGHLHNYMELRREVMRIPKLNMYDLYNPLFPAAKQQYSWEEAVEMVKSSLEVMGSEYMEAVELAFTQRWADVPERKGKRSGAYSSGCYDTYPYMLLNFHGTLNDVFTLTHELGHSIHSFYSHKYQPYHYADYSILLAEVASTTNEMLLSDMLIRESKDQNMRILLLTHLIDEIRATLYRQTMFAEFELWMHQKAEAQIPLTRDLLCEHYLELNNRYHGPAVKADSAIAYEWARIPHFYYNYYVYKYATGISSAISFARNILCGDEACKKAYLGFLAAGDSKDPLDILADAGVDLAGGDAVASALDYFGELTERLRAEIFPR